MPERVTLRTGGVVYTGWQSIAVQRSIEGLAGTFDLMVSERQPGALAARAIKPGDSCTVEVAGQVALTGWVDGVFPRYTAESHRVRVRGRDRAGDLVDASALHAPGEWRNLSLERLARILCEPFGISVRADVSTGRPFDKFTLQQGETVHAALERLARMRAVLIISDGLGGVVITRAGLELESQTLVQGENLLEGSGVFDDRDRFSEYVFRAQRPSTDFATGAQVNRIKARSTDPEMRRYRPLVVVAEAPAAGATLTDRARWEATRRAGRARRATVAVQGWRTAAGHIWQPNRRVRLRDAFLGIDREMLIVTTTARLAETGSATVLELARPEAYELIELPDEGGAELSPTFDGS
ncbi:MAG: phage baseplate assembly protein [Planctomycetota bacterium]|jgi:prophage tail gpP-like protein